MKKIIILIIVAAFYIISCQSPSDKNTFTSNWNTSESRTWIGPDYWTNPLQDWQAEKGRLSCLVAGANRSIHLLTHSLGSESGDFETRITIGLPTPVLETNSVGWAGFLIGAKGEFNDYRDDALYGKGIKAGISTTMPVIYRRDPKGKSTGFRNYVTAATY